MTGRYLPMSQSEIEEYIATQCVARLATIAPKDGPLHVVPMWYVVVNGFIVIRSSSDALRKMRHLQQTGKLALVIDDGEEYTSLRGVMIQGRARFLNAAEIPRAQQAFREKYYGGQPEFQTFPEPLKEILFDLTFTYAEIHPTHIVSWDNSKWVERNVEKTK